MHESQDRAKLFTHLSLVAGIALARGESFAVFQVRDICDAASVDSPHRYSFCCEILDSEAFARRESLIYHHRTGVWGTDDATYAFTFTTTKGAGQRRLGRALLLLLLCIGAFSVGLYLLKLTVD